MKKHWNNLWMLIMLLVLVILGFVLIREVNPAGNAILSKAFKSATTMVLFSVFKILLVFVVVMVIFVKNTKNEE